MINRLILYISGALLLASGLMLIGQGEAMALDENNCLSCHGNEGFTKTTDSGQIVSLYVDVNEVNTAAHRYIDCTKCHSENPHSADSPLNKLSLAEKCGSCHEYEYELHIQSVHGQQLLEGNSDVATCVDCHSTSGSPHAVLRVLEYNAPTYKKNISETCAKCHGDEELMADYGIVEKVYESYMRSFHGKAIQLGTYEITQLDKATCTNCHGYHDIKSTSDPDSPVGGLENLAATCEQCHIGAGAEFAAGFLGHKEASPENVAPVYYIEVFFRVILSSVLGFGAIVVIAAIIRFSLNKWRK